MRRRALACILLSVAIGTSLSVTPASAEIGVVALGARGGGSGGDPLPDGDGVFFAIGTPVLNDRGEVAFPSSFLGPTGGSGLFRGTTEPGSLRTLVRQGWPAPDGNGSVPILTATSPTLNDAGQIAFSTRFTGTFEGVSVTAALRTEPDTDALTLLARDGEIVAGVSTALRALRLEVGQPPALNRSGQAAFTAAQGIFVDGVDTPLVLSGQSGPNGGGTLSGFTSAALNDAGQVAFRAQLSTAPRNGIFRADSSGILQIVRQGDPVPGSDGTFGALGSAPGINAAGAVAFYAAVDGASGPATNGIFRSPGDGGPIVPLVLRGDRTPSGNGSVLTFGSTLAPLNDAGQTTFAAKLTGSSQGTQNDIIIARSDGSELREIARKGDLAPDGDGTFFDFDQPTLNNAGQVAFLASVTGSAHAFGIFLYDDDAGLTQVVRVGDCVRGGMITTLRFATFGSDGRTHTGLNEQGQIAFAFTLQDERVGAAVWTRGNEQECPGDLQAVRAYFLTSLTNGLPAPVPVAGQQVYAYLDYQAQRADPPIRSDVVVKVDDTVLWRGAADLGASGRVWCDQPWTASAGAHVLRWEIDPDDAVEELDEANNVAQYAFAVLGGGTRTAPPTSTPTPTVAPQVCAGDCNGDRLISVDDLIKVVNVALGNAALAQCPAGDVDGSTAITINEILVAVNNALAGCPAAPTPTQTPLPK